MDIKRSKVHRNLDAKFKVGGLEALDLLVSLILGALMSLCFSGTVLEIPLVFGAPLLVLAILYFGKRGKPEGFLLDFLRFYLEPGFFSAGQEPREAHRVRKKICNNSLSFPPKGEEAMAKTTSQGMKNCEDGWKEHKN